VSRRLIVLAIPVALLLAGCSYFDEAEVFGQEGQAVIYVLFVDQLQADEMWIDLHPDVKAETSRDAYVQCALADVDGVQPPRRDGSEGAPWEDNPSDNVVIADGVRYSASETRVEGSFTYVDVRVEGVDERTVTVVFQDAPQVGPTVVRTVPEDPCLIPPPTPTRVPVSTPTPTMPVWTVSQLHDGRNGEGPPEGTVTVDGVIVAGGDGYFLCEMFRDGSCGPWVVLTNGRGDDAAPITGHLIAGENRFVIDGRPDGTAPLPGDDEIADALIEAAITGTIDIGALMLADEVVLELTDRISVRRPSADLADRANWLLADDACCSRMGPFSALELLAGSDNLGLVVGPHDRCVGPPAPAAAELIGLRHLSIQPIETACHNWFAVDLYLNKAGHVVAITLDLLPIFK
jgi:hypothetical protein